MVVEAFIIQSVKNMKNRIFNGAAAAAALLLFLSACAKDEITIVPITIDSVTTIADQTTPITQAAMGDFIAIHGEGLDKANITSVKVNDIEIDLDEVYTENSTLYMKIPVTLPENQTDKIYITNDKGTKEIPFVVIAPDLKLERMFNEYTAPGDTLMIYGQFFELYDINAEDATVYFGNTPSKVIASSDTYLTTQVPANVEKNVKVKVVADKHDTEAVCPGYYYDRQCMIMDFDTLVPSDAQYVVTDPKDSYRLSGNFLRIDPETSWSSWWYIAQISGTAVTDDMLDNYEDYEVKMEFCSANQLVDGKIAFYTYLFWDASPMAWTPSDIKFQNFNRWETITVPFVVNRSKSYPENYRYHSFNIRLESSQEYTRNFCIDNVRICKKGA